jgi:D-beta-D-heptose 7-phosphate kinase/D-beta-D-heptose 1-phosphate adenosyltransferase
LSKRNPTHQGCWISCVNPTCTTSKKLHLFNPKSKIKNQKSYNFMNADSLTLINGWASLTVLVIGDAMLDCYLHGQADRLCQEAPVPVVTVTRSQDQPGGAANTAVNLASLGATPLLLSVIGSDGEGDRLQQALIERRVSVQHLITTANRRTLAKQRIVANAHLLVRFDQGNINAIAPEQERLLLARLPDLFNQCDAVIVSDYGYGVVTPAVIHTLAALQAQQPHVMVVDSKHLANYREVGITAVKPNYQETIQLLGLPKQAEQRAEQITPYGDRLLSLTGATIVAVTLDVEGAIVFERGQKPIRLNAQPSPAHHTSGAGDTFVGALALALAAKAPTSLAATLAATATAVVVKQPGLTTCSQADLLVGWASCPPWRGGQDAHPTRG